MKTFFYSLFQEVVPVISFLQHYYVSQCQDYMWWPSVKDTQKMYERLLETNKWNTTGLTKIKSYYFQYGSSVQFSSVTQSCLTLCDPMNCSTPGLPVHHQLLEFTQTHVYLVSDAIKLSHPLSSPSPPAPNPSQHQGLFQWVKSSHEVAKVLEFHLQHQSFQWIPRADLL